MLPLPVALTAHLLLTQVCGHYDCGGIRASTAGRDHGVLETWLTTLRDVARLHFGCR